MNKILKITCLALIGVLLLPGCSVTKVEYEKKADGEISYRIYRNGHWLKLEAEGMSGGMTGDGEFKIALDGMKSSPSEEFNRTMQTYTTAFIQLAQIAAASYNPSASAALQNVSANQSAATKSASAATTPAEAAPAATTKSASATTAQPSATATPDEAAPAAATLSSQPSTLNSQPASAPAPSATTNSTECANCTVQLK